MYLICKRAWRRPRSTQTHQPTRYALHPCNEALPYRSTPYGPRFCPPAACPQAQTTPHSQLAASSLLRRARRPDTARRTEVAATGRLQHRESRRHARPGQPVHTRDCRARQCSAGTPATDTAVAQPRKSGQKSAAGRGWWSTWCAPCRSATSPPAAAKPVAGCPQVLPNLPQPNQRPAPATHTRQQANAAKKAPVSASAEAGAAYRRMTATPAGRHRGS